MAKSEYGKKERRRARRRARRVAKALLVLAVLLVAAPVATPVLGIALALPFVLLGLTVAALALAFAAALLGAPAYLSYRLIRHHMGQQRREVGGHEPLPASSMDPDTLLRRRYVAGELSYQDFQQQMVGRLKDRFARGELGVSDFEAELERLLEPARRLDVRRDPALAGPAPRGH